MVVVQIDPVSEIIPSNVGLTRISLLRCSIIYPYNWRSGDRNGKSIVKCLSLFALNRLLLLMIKHCMQKLQRLHGSTSIHANIMDTFHTITNLLASNGKRFQDVEFILICVGLRDKCILPGIIAERKLSGVSYGRMYNRAVQYWKDGGNTSRIWWMKRIQDKGRNGQQAEVEETVKVIRKMDSGKATVDLTNYK